MDEIKIRSIEKADITRLKDFFITTNMLSKDDSTFGLEHGLENNPELSQLAELKGVIVGAVLCSFDGFRGFLNKLVVAEAYRKAGVGRKLIAAASSTLQKINCPELIILCHPYLVNWYKDQGFSKIDKLIYSKTLTPDKTVSGCD